LATTTDTTASVPRTRSATAASTVSPQQPRKVTFEKSNTTSIGRSSPTASASSGTVVRSISPVARTTSVSSQ
jgi:hypothetical protein